MKISVNAGHTASGTGYGAEYKGFRESEINRAVVKALIPKLQKLGHTVHNSTVDTATTNSAYLRQVVKSANNSGADLFISIHCNASAGHTGYGTECWTYKGAQHDAAILHAMRRDSRRTPRPCGRNSSGSPTDVLQ